MHFKSSWSYLNKELLALLGFLVISTLGALVYLTYTLVGLHNFSMTSGDAVSTAFVLQDLLINVEQTESSARGYALTGDSAFLGPYTASTEVLPADIHILRTNHNLLLSSNQVENIRHLTDQKIEFSKKIIMARDSEGLEAAQQMVGAKQGEEVMNALRGEINNVASYSLKNIGPMQKKANANIERARWVGAAMGLLVLVTSGAVIWYFKRAILHERALESTKNEFLSLASHQLRTPATNVKQYIGLLLEGYMGDLTEQQRHALLVADRNNEAAITIMNNLLDVAKLDLERIQLHKKVTDIVKIAQHVIREYSHRIRERGQTIKLTGAKQALASVDEPYIKGVIENIVDNAMKYSLEGAKITVTIDREDDHVCISIKDTGLGIKKRDYSKLFNKFSRLDNEFSANSQGSGLGLYWAKQIITLHKGTIGVESKENKGTTFKIQLPVR